MGSNIYYRSIFWGVILILIGIAVLSKSFFHIDIPLATLIIALVLIAIGIQIMIGGYGFHGIHHWHGFGYHVIKYEAGSGDKQYDLRYKGITLDLSSVTLDKGSVRIDINGSFGGGIVILNPDLPVKIEADISFGGVTFPDGGVVGFGQGNYQSKNFNPDSPHLFIRVNASFGGLRFVTNKDDYRDWRGMKYQWKAERKMWKHRYRDRY
jgi:hypothetical protein